MDQREIRLRCIEAAAGMEYKRHGDVLGAAKDFEVFVLGEEKKPVTKPQEDKIGPGYSEAGLGLGVRDDSYDKPVEACSLIQDGGGD
jgi:hypothetical protein